MDTICAQLRQDAIAPTDRPAKGKAAEITEAAHREGLEAIKACGGSTRRSGGFRKCCLQGIYVE